MNEPPLEPPRLLAASDRSLLVSFGDRVGGDLHDRVRRLLRALDAAPLAGITNLVPAYASILIRFDPALLDHDRVADHALRALERGAGLQPEAKRQVEVPVCYGGEHGTDLEEVARLCGLTARQVVEAHAGTLYQVYFLGFVPGFAYMGDLPAPIACARLDTPRRMVPAGSVGIAGRQTGVYPAATPGGWRLIGRTPLRLFDPRREPMCLLEMGDRVRFVPTPPERFAALAGP